MTIPSEVPAGLRDPGVDVVWSTASPAQRAASLGLDYDRLSARAARVSRVAPPVAISTAAAVAFIVPVLRMVDRPVVETTVPVIAFFVVFVFGLLLGFASILMGLRAGLTVSQRIRGGKGWIRAVITVIVCNTLWIGGVALVATMEVPGAMWLVPPGIIAADSIGLIMRVQIPVQLLRDPSDEARRGIHGWLRLDPRSNGTGRLNWISAHAVFDGLSAAAAAILVFRYGLPIAPIALIALIALNLLSATLEIRSYRVAVVTMGVAAFGAIWLVASST
ncbi:hypothetical protein ACFPER_15085 [Agromyces aurantiacus]|uniref:Uncharacterized protein n=1 Tax=Agromyces aurantiacus TaxID=165814 RepID=A0ABV9RD66_9MICO|nr:hypothetical protein [Agromyces aurantiacus]MBM7504980.1 hypothetical protein [Agromyces aurantiacus]